ncbi:hypothetical protein Agub_g13245 [Astrephomene gubernaculifera]|uniref:Transmembrane protein n=1 Tax=Astrephomene gubernaculifera TaxID=47775 RepID=A0AAD3E3X2_9CHLO|nr:hypothetical protein Agub_g13245 [Astrephomene gubernaculifera]
MSRENSDDELASSSVWVASQERTRSSQLQGGRAVLMSSGSLALRQGDWRRVAAATTDGTPVQAPAPLQSTPNIDDVHSPASSTYNPAGSPDRQSLLDSTSPLRPRILAPGSVADFTPNNFSGIPFPSATHLASTGRADKVASPDTPGEPSFRWGSPTKSNGGLSTPTSDEYDSPPANFGLHPGSTLHLWDNSLYVPRTARKLQGATKTSCVTSEAAVKLNLRGCGTELDCAASSVSGDGAPTFRAQLEPGNVPSAAPSPAPSGLTTPGSVHFEAWSPRQTILALSALVSSSVRDGGVSSIACSETAGGDERKAEGQSFPADGSKPARLSGHEVPASSGPSTAAPCAATGLHADVHVAEDCVALVAAYAASNFNRCCSDGGCQATASILPSTAAPASMDVGACQVEADDTRPDAGLDQTPRKTGKGSAVAGHRPSERKHVRRGLGFGQEPAKAQASGPARSLSSEQPRSDRGAVASSTLWAVASCVLLATLAILVAPAIYQPHGNPGFGAEPSDFVSTEQCTHAFTQATAWDGSYHRLGLSSARVPFCWARLPNCHLLDGLLLAQDDLFPGNAQLQRKHASTTVGAAVVRQAGTPTAEVHPTVQEVVSRGQPLATSSVALGDFEVSVSEHGPLADADAVSSLTNDEEAAAEPSSCETWKQSVVEEPIFAGSEPQPLPAEGAEQQKMVLASSMFAETVPEGGAFAAAASHDLSPNAGVAEPSIALEAPGPSFVAADARAGELSSTAADAEAPEPLFVAPEAGEPPSIGAACAEAVEPLFIVPTSEDQSLVSAPGSEQTPAAADVAALHEQPSPVATASVLLYTAKGLQEGTLVADALGGSPPLPVRADTATHPSRYPVLRLEYYNSASIWMVAVATAVSLLVFAVMRVQYFVKGFGVSTAAQPRQSQTAAVTTTLRILRLKKESAGNTEAAVQVVEPMNDYVDHQFIMVDGRLKYVEGCAPKDIL